MPSEVKRLGEVKASAAVDEGGVDDGEAGWWFDVLLALNRSEGAAAKASAAAMAAAATAAAARAKQKKKHSEDEIKTVGSVEDEDIHMPAAKRAAMASAVALRAAAGGSAAEVDFDITDPPLTPVHPASDHPVLESASQMGEHDVLCGRGQGANSQNRRYRALVRDFQPTYLMAKRREKPLMARSVALVVRKRGGRFLRKDDTDGRLYEVGDEKAEAKTSQAPREGLDVRATKTAANTLLRTENKKKKSAPVVPIKKDGAKPVIQFERPKSMPTSKTAPIHVPPPKPPIRYAEPPPPHHHPYPPHGSFRYYPPGPYPYPAPLTAMFAASPANVPAVGGGGDIVHNQGPNTADGYNVYPVYRDHRAHASSGGGSQPPQAKNSAPPLGPMPAPLGPNKRIKMLSMGPLTLPTMDLSKRSDLYILLKRLAPAFAGFQFKLPEVDLPSSSYESNYLPTDQQLTIAKRRVNSSLCVFGGSVPRRTVSFEVDAELTPGQKREKDEKAAYEKDLSSRYFLKEHCISWDVEVHDVVVQDRKSLNSKGKDSMKYCAPVTPSTPNNHNLNNVVLGIREKGKKVKYRCKLCGQPKQNHTCPNQSTVMRSIGAMVYPAVNAFVSDEPGKLAPPLSEMNNFTTLLSQDMSVNTQNYHRPDGNGFNVLAPVSQSSSKVVPIAHKPNATPSSSIPTTNVITTKPPRPYTEYTMFYQLEREFILHRLLIDESDPMTAQELQAQSDCALFKNDPLMPARYRTLPLRADWYISGKSKKPCKRKHRKTHGKIGFLELTRMIAARWAKVDDETRKYCKMMAAMEAVKYKEDVESYNSYKAKLEEVGQVPEDVKETPGAMSAISTPSTPGNRKRDHLLMSRTMSGVSTSGGCANDDSLFRGIMELKPEQYRRVRFKADPTKQEDAYRYTHIPTPYSQRKEMGDTLFALSREVPKLADSCAAILRSAREDCWDQAVAELTTQVLIVLKCEEQDYSLEGLKRHLLTLGIAC